MNKIELLRLALLTLEQAESKGNCEYEVTGLIRAALAQPAPVAWISTSPARMIHWTSDKPAYGDDWIPLYTAPPQKEWVGLTDNERKEIFESMDGGLQGFCKTWGWLPFTKAIEEKLKEKNT